jgi:hypothetical protein
VQAAPILLKRPPGDVELAGHVLHEVNAGSKYWLAGHRHPVDDGVPAFEKEPAGQAWQADVPGTPKWLTVQEHPVTAVVPIGEVEDAGQGVHAVAAVPYVLTSHTH